VGRELAQHLQRAAILLEAIAAGDVEVEPVALSLGEEVAAIAKALPVEEFVLAEPVHGLHVAVVGVGGGRDEGVAEAMGFHGGLEAMQAAFAILATDVFGAVIGLKPHLLQTDAAGREVGDDPLGEDASEAGGAGLGVVGEGEAGAHFPGGVLHQRQAQGLGLRPIAGDVVQVLGIMAELGEDGPGGFAGSQILFGDMLALAGAHQAVLAEDASDGAHAGV
jgi:hypothetical protein